MVENRQLTPEKRAKFFKALAKKGNVSYACRSAKVSRFTVYQHRKEDPQFAAEWEEALELAIEALELEARRRAEEGTRKPIYYKGGQVGYVREYSDTLLIFLLKAHRPAVYRENLKIEHDFTQLPDDELLQRAGEIIARREGDPGGGSTPGADADSEPG